MRQVPRAAAGLELQHQGAKQVLSRTGPPPGPEQLLPSYSTSSKDEASGLLARVDDVCMHYSDEIGVELAGFAPKSIVVIEDGLQIKGWFVNPYDALEQFSIPL